MALQIRRGTDAERTAGGGVMFAEGELIYVTDTDALYVGDGSTAGGVKLTDNAGAVLGTYITADTINSTLDLQQNLDLNGNNVIGTGNIDITGNINATGNIVAGGNIDIGDADTDTLTISAKVDSGITPETDTAYDLGTASLRWRNIYANGATIDGQVDAVAINADVVADNSTVMVDASANTFTGDLTGSVTGDTAGTHTGAVVGDVTGDTTGYHTGDVKGSVFGNDSTPIVDAVANTLNGNLTGDVTGNVAGNVTGDHIGQVKGSGGSAVLAPNTGPADAVISAFDINATGTITGGLTGDVLGNLTGNAAGDHTGTFAGVLTATGTLDGDVTGSIFADDSTLLVDAVAGNIPASVVSGTFTGNVTGDTAGVHTGNIFTTLIDSADSSTISFTPDVQFDASVSIDQAMQIGTGGSSTSTIITPTSITNYNGTNLNGAVYTNILGSDINDPNAFPLQITTAFETKGGAGSFFNGIQVIGDGTTAALQFFARTTLNDTSALKFTEYSGVVGDEAQEEDGANYTDVTTISNSVADFGTAVKFASMTTTVRDALTAAAGMVVFNTTDTKLQVYTGSGWVDLH